MSCFTNYSDDALFYHHSLDENPDPADFTMHNHSTYEIYYFISGKGNFYIEGNEYPLHPGDLLIMRSAEAHYISVAPEVPYERFALHFCRELIQSVDGDGLLLEPFEARAAGAGNLFAPRDFKDGLYAALINNIMDFTGQNKRLQAVSNLFALLNEIRTAFTETRDRSFTEKETLSGAIIGYINGNLNSRLSLDSICKRFFISKAQLCRIFKKTAGASVWEYITAKRLAAAREMILSGIPPTSAFSECGFRDYSAFYRAYVRHFGFTPAKTR